MSEINKLSSPAVSAGGSEHAGRQVEPAASGSDLAATGTGLPSGVPVPVAAALDVPVGRSSPVSPDTGVPPQEADRLGPRMWVLAEQPGLEVEAVRDDDGDIWVRVPEAGCDGWAPPNDPILVIDWAELLYDYGPLIDATAEITSVVAGLKSSAGPVSNTPGTGPAEPADDRLHWAVRHPGIGVLGYDDEPSARTAAGTAGEVLCRRGDEGDWGLAP